MRPHPHEASKAGAGGPPAAVGALLLGLGLGPLTGAHAQATEAPLPLCPAPEETIFACPLRGGGGLQLCAPARSSDSDSDSDSGMSVVLRELGLDGSPQWSFGDGLPAGEAYKANFLTTGALTMAHLRFEHHGVEYVLLVGEDQTQGLAGLAHATAPGRYEWRMCEENWKSRLDYRFYGEARIPADPVAAPLP